MGSEFMILMHALIIPSFKAETDSGVIWGGFLFYSCMGKGLGIYRSREKEY